MGDGRRCGLLYVSLSNRRGGSHNLNILNIISLIRELVDVAELLGILCDDDERLGVDAGRGVQGPGQRGRGGEDDQAVEDPHRDQSWRNRKMVGDYL